MFWKPKTKTEWSLVIGVVTLTLAWIVLRWQWFPPQLRGEGGFRIATGPVVDLLVIVPLWLIYGIMRVQVRRRHSSLA